MAPEAHTNDRQIEQLATSIGRLTANCSAETAEQEVARMARLEEMTKEFVGLGGSQKILDEAIERETRAYENEYRFGM